jgi:hypothetical protein
MATHFLVKLFLAAPAVKHILSMQKQNCAYFFPQANFHNNSPLLPVGIAFQSGDS